jgi:hypothetical protein
LPNRNALRRQSSDLFVTLFAVLQDHGENSKRGAMIPTLAQKPGTQLNLFAAYCIFMIFFFVFSSSGYAIDLSATPKNRYWTTICGRRTSRTNAFLGKPYQLQGLSDTIHRVLVDMDNPHA